MLKDNPNNRNAIQVQRVLDGKIMCSAYNLRMCYFDASVKERDSIKTCLEEIKEKMDPELRQDQIIHECIEEFREKLDIYDRFLRELSRREAEEEERLFKGSAY